MRVTWESVGLAARRISSFAASIEEAHALGFGPGRHDELWGREFHRDAIWVWEQTLPWAYLGPLARGFCDIALHMGEHAAPKGPPESWAIVAEYLHTAGTVLLDHAPTDMAKIADAQRMGERTPSVVRFDELAKLASADGAARLRLAGEDVARHVEPATRHAPPTLSDEELSILRSLAAGRRMVEIAEDHGFSERSLYRLLRDIWETLGATSRMEGLAIAIREGLLDED